jgi:organic radical activating enzyme
MKQSSNILFNICYQCNARCRHCSNGDTIKERQESDPNQILEWLADVAEAGLKMATFVGGEPFLMLDDLRRYCARAVELGLKSSIITNGYWAKTREEAIAILQSLSGLNSLVVSSDIYHLEFIDSQVVKNALDACLELNIEVALNITCASKVEKTEALEIYGDYKNKLFIYTPMMMPIGAASELPIERRPVLEKADSLPAFCAIGNFSVKQTGDVFACCNAIVPEEPFLYIGNMVKQKFPELMKEFEKNPLYVFIKEYGPRGIGRIFRESPYFEEFRQKAYTCECDFCLDLLVNPERQQYFLRQIASQS